jgi:hypothetical protein
VIVARALRNVDDLFSFICRNAKALIASFKKLIARCCVDRFARRQTPSGVVLPCAAIRASAGAGQDWIG